MFKLGRVFGIQLYANITSLILLSLAAISFYNIAAYRFHLPVGVAICMSILFGVGALGSILFHEVGHALMARSFGVRCRMIVLHLFGGAAFIEDNFPTPKSEFLIALAGPVASFVLCLGLFLSAAFLPAELAPLLVMLSVANFMLGAFNLVPAFPLDGGRILRSALWKASGDFRKATRWAGFSGYLFGGALILSGVLMVCGFTVPVFGAGAGSGIWNALMGWMVIDMAKREVART